MFFELVSRNSKRNRKENSLLFSSLFISIIAFYLILSLSNQEVMLFLAEMESDAVNRLFQLIPAFYGMTLVILFFLIYFASKYQLESRKHELGMYLMLGMRRYKLFFLLLTEDIRNSMAALAAGLPIAILISELISLITAKLVGIGIIGHRFSISTEAIVLTVAGFLVIKLVAFLILSGRIVHQEVGDLLAEKAEGSKRQFPAVVYLISFMLGILLLGLAYFLAIGGAAWFDFKLMAVTLAAGLIGTLLIFFGLRFVMNSIAKNKGKGHRLHTFIFRQLQEIVIRKSNVMAVSSLLILAALCCFGSGVAITGYYGESEPHIIDYTFPEGEETETIQAQLETNELTELFGSVVEIQVGSIRVDDRADAWSMRAVLEQVNRLPESREKDVLMNQLGYVDSPYLLSLSGYNQLLALAQQPKLSLGEQEAAVYRDSEWTTETRTKLLNQILTAKPEVTIAGEDFHLSGTVQSTNLVVDRSITLSFALIVPDAVFERMTAGEHSTYINAVLSEEQTKEKSLMQAFMDVNARLNQAGIVYESYLQNMGRQLFYIVAASYITIYLAIVFLVIANTVIGIQFLTQLRRTKRRYQTLIRIGASYQSLCDSVRKQMNWFFGVPVGVAAISSVFGIRALFAGLLSPVNDINIAMLMFSALAMMLLLCVVEYIYMKVVVKSGRHYLLSLMTPEREE